MSDEARRWDLALTQMAQLRQPAGAPGNVALMLEQLCKAAVEHLGASGVGVSVMADGESSGFAGAYAAGSTWSTLRVWSSRPLGPAV